MFFFLWNSVLRSWFWLTESKGFLFLQFFLRLASFFFGGGGVSFIHFGACGTLDSGIAVHSYTVTQMWIGWTLALQSIAQTSTN